MKISKAFSCLYSLTENYVNGYVQISGGNWLAKEFPILVNIHSEDFNIISISNSWFLSKTKCQNMSHV